MVDHRLIAALDIGTTEIVCLVGEVDPRDDLYIIGAGVTEAEGLRRGVVVDMDATVAAIRKAISLAEESSGTSIDSVTVGISGEFIRSINSHGVVAVARSDHEVTEHDVQKVIEAARTVAIPVDREIIHVVPQVFAVDDQHDILDPIGMTGVRLEVHAHLVTASLTSARNIYRALDRANVNVDHVIYDIVGLAEALPSSGTSEESVLVDLGGDLTNVCVVVDGAIRHTAVVPLGARSVTNDMAIGLKTTVDQAEALKRTHGAALTSIVNADEMITVTSAAQRTEREISRNVLAAIIQPRMEEILSLVGQEIAGALPDRTLSGGVVVCGGGALLPGTCELIEQLFGRSARMATLDFVAHTPEELASVRYLTPHALVAYGFAHEPPARAGKGVGSLLRRFEQWLGNKL